MKGYSNEKIKEALTKITSRNKVEYSKLCKVIEVDDTDNVCVCKPLDGSAEFTNVRFAISPDSKNVQIPLVDSVVIISYFDKQNAYIIQTDGVDKYVFRNDSEDLKDILTNYINDLHSALSKATWSSPAGPTVPNPINFAEFDLAKQNAINSINKLFK